MNATVRMFDGLVIFLALLGIGYGYLTGVSRTGVEWVGTTAFVLSVPLFGLAQTISPLPAVAAPDEPCIAANSVLPVTKSAREATAAKAAASAKPATKPGA